MRNYSVLAALIALLAVDIDLYAGHQGESSVVFRLQGNFTAEVILDGRRQYQTNSKAVRFDHLHPGSHYVKIYRLRPGHHWYPPRRELLYSGHIRPRPGFLTTFGIHHGHLRLLNVRPLSFHGPGPQYYGPGPCSSHGTYNCGCPGFPQSNHPYWGPPVNDHGCYQGYCGGQCGGNCSYHEPYSDQGYFEPYDQYHEYEYYGDQGYSQGGGQWKVISERAFSSILNRADNYFTDDQKADFFLREINGQRVTTAQVRRMAGELFFEQQKYRLLTSLFENVVDQEYYKKLADELMFSKTKRDFEDYIREHRREK